MEFSEVLRRRRMVRNYADEPIDDEVLARIAEAGRRAPSAGFSQGMAFVIVTDPSIRLAIAALAGEAEYVAHGFDPWISRAPAHLVLCVSEAAYHRRYREADKVDDQGNEIEWPIPYWWVDAGAAMMTVLLTTVDEGLAAGFLGVHSIPGLRSLLDIPPDFTPIGIVTIGRGLEDRRSSSLRRGWRPAAEVIHWQRWQQANG